MRPGRRPCFQVLPPSTEVAKTDIAAAPSDAAGPARDVEGADDGAAPGEGIRLDLRLVHAVSIREGVDADFRQRSLSGQRRGERQTKANVTAEKTSAR